MKLLDGSLSGANGSNTDYGAKFGIVGAAGSLAEAVLTSSHAGVKVDIADGASGKGGENAVWDEDGLTLTLNLVAGETYTQNQIDDLIKNATQLKDATATPPDISLKLKNGVLAKVADGETTGATVGGIRTTGGVALDKQIGKGTEVDATPAGGALKSADYITFTANTYGNIGDTAGALEISILTDVGAGKETANPGKADDGTIDATKIELHLATGVSYTEKDIEDILAKNGYDFSVKLEDKSTPDGDSDLSVYFNVKQTSEDSDFAKVTLTAGQGVGKDSIPSSGNGLTFQIGANGVEDQRVTLNVDNMGSAALGVANADVSTRDAANKAIDMVDAAVKKVSMQRAGLGALQNRLEYTVNNLTTTNENLTNAESQIRDTDMATEMINYTKFNILQQASQAMLAQANQQPQAVLQLLG